MATCGIFLFQKMLIIVVAASLFSENSATIRCPKIVLIEEGHKSVIKCNSLTNNVSDVYWYRGSTLTTGPILQLENGIPGGSEYNKGHFSIDHSGAMTVRNASIEHEALYTFVVYFGHATHERSSVTVKITNRSVRLVTPHPPCLEVTLCPPCQECTLNVSDSLSGQLMCSVAGAKPNIKTDWIIKSQTGLGLVIHGAVEIHDSYTDSWSSMVNVSYESNGCGEEAVLRCIAKDDLGLLETSYSQIKLFTDTCKDEVESTKIGAIFIVPVLLVVVIFAVTLIYYIRKGKLSRQNMSRPGQISDFQLTQVKDLPFISRFKEVYEKECRLSFLPCDESVPVDVLYADCQCDLTFPNGDTAKFSSNKVLTSVYIRNEKRVLIVGDAGYGKTMFTKRYVQQWSKETSKDYYIFFLSLEDLKESMNLSEIIKSKIFKGTEIQSEDIEDLFKKNKCVFVLDGLHEKHFKRKSKSMSKQDELISQGEDISSGSNGDLKVTINELLTDSLNDKYENVHVWVTASDLTDVKSLFSKPHLQVKLNSFSESELREYVKRTCSYYASLKDVKLQEETVKGSSYTNTKASTSQHEECKSKSENGTQCHEGTLHAKRQVDIPNETLPLMHGYGNYPEMVNIGVGDGNVFDTVWGLLDKNDIFDIFRETPHILILTIHILSGKFARNVSPPREVSINNMATLIDSIITCLKDKYTKESEGTYSLEKFNDLKEKLGDIAIQTTSSNKTSNLERVSLQDDITDQVKAAIAMGVLIPPHNQDTHGTGNAGITSLSGLKFSHYIFQDYFTAYYFVQNPEHLQKTINSLGQDRQNRSFGYLKFSSLFPKQSFRHLCNVLLKLKMYNDLFCCLYERGDETEIERIGRLQRHMDIVLPRVTSNHQQEAIKVFLQACCDLGVKLWTVGLVEKDALKFLKTLQMPTIQYIEFFQLTFSDEDLGLVLEWINQIRRTRNVRFVQCKTPHVLSSQSHQSLRELKKLFINVEGLF